LVRQLEIILAITENTISRASGGLKNSVAVVIIKVARRKKAVLSVTSDYAARDKGRVVVDTTVINGS